ncbi:MAG: adenosylmethionine--8-amino-7-oxononanoate transaminase [Candidatus Omnitrophota bacterium]
MNSFIEKDLKYMWHPYTQMKDCEQMPPILVEKAEGIKIYDTNGNFYYDTISSWWCNVHGHNHPVIKDAIKKQLDQFEHVLFAGFTHKPAVELAERLIEITPKNLQRVFFSDNGSTSVEVAMKMSFQYWKNVNKKGRNFFISLDKGYHGDTIGAMSVSGVDLFNKKFEKLFFKTFKAPTPYCYRCPVGAKKNECALECLSKMEDILKREADRISAIIIEPILMGAGGMIIYPAAYLKGVWELSKKYDVHLIVDEVATGFGRTGKMFASEHAEVSPDFMCLSKGITSGYLPLGVTLMTERIFNSFYDDFDKLKTFYHGHTYTANPISCAAAVAAVDLFKKENTLENVREIGIKLQAFLSTMAELAIVGDVRTIGAVGVMELVRNKDTKEYFSSTKRIGLEVYRLGLKKNLLLRPLGDIIYFFLPLSISQVELKDIFCRTAEVMHKLIKLI